MDEATTSGYRTGMPSARAKHTGKRPTTKLAGNEADPSQVSTVRAGYFRERYGYRIRRPHGTDDWLLIYTRRGNGRLRFPGGELESRRGDLTIYQPRVPHDYGLAKDGRTWELAWVHFQPRPDWQELLRLPSLAPGLLHIRLTDPAIRDRVETSLIEMARLQASPYRLRKALTLNALEAALLWCDPQNPASDERLLDPRVRRAAELLCERSEKPIQVAELARAVALSPSRLAHLFREQMRTSLQQFHETQRMARARQLLEHTDHQIGWIADTLGFKNAYYFSVRFRKMVGISPRAFRQRARHEKGTTLI